MEPEKIVDILLGSDEPVDARSLIEASVHLPRRGRRWVASYRGETGRQVWRTTGLRDRAAALALAQGWEAVARRKRAAQPVLPRKPPLRVRPGGPGLTQKEVGLVLGLSERAVRSIEKQALAKLRDALRGVWREWKGGEVQEAALGLELRRFYLYK
jgi:hypothetical protein